MIIASRLGMWAVALGLLCFTAPVTAETIVVGNDAVPRSLASGDTAIYPFIMVLNEDVFPTGTIVEWEAHVVNILGSGRRGELGLLVLTPGAELGSYTVSATDIRDARVGLNVFEPTAIPVNANDILALYIYTARVSLDFSGNNPTGPISYFLQQPTPRVGDVLTIPDGASIRTYSINATVVTDPVSS